MKRSLKAGLVGLAIGFAFASMRTNAKVNELEQKAVSALIECNRKIDKLNFNLKSNSIKAQSDLKKEKSTCSFLVTKCQIKMLEQAACCSRKWGGGQK